ncbi:MAG TPA: hypothetical protein VLC07_04195 [Solirubrobacterales bacterium]|nr:hypothetical protein [Solirubrobacterales bacterium]
MKEEGMSHNIERADMRDAAIYELTLNVLGYKEEGEWVALALEMDLRGYGATFRDAVSDLLDLITMQVTFAHSKGHPEMVWKPAEGHWWSLFGQIRMERLEASLRTGHSSDEEDYGIAGIKIPPAYAIASFSGADA